MHIAPATPADEKWKILSSLDYKQLLNSITASGAAIITCPAENGQARLVGCSFRYRNVR
jgi:hypothetical protein